MTQIIKWYDDEPVRLSDYRTTEEFLAYRERVIEVLKRRKGAINLATIHKALGKRARRDWTLDALEAEYVLKIPKLPCDLFAYEPDVRVIASPTAADTTSALFAGNVRYEDRHAVPKRRYNGVTVLTDGRVTV